MINYISGLIFVILLVIGGVVSLSLGAANPVLGVVVGFFWLLGDIILSSGVQLAAQWEQGVVFRLGRYECIKGPGLFFIIPLVDQVKLVDTRIRAMDIPAQQMITKDNVPVKINGVIFFKVDQVADSH